MFKQTKWTMLCLIFSLVIAGLLFPVATDAEDEQTALIEQIKEISEGIINWKKSETGASSDDFLLNNHYLQSAGESAGDWYPIGIGRLGYPDDYQAYLAVIEDVVAKRYDSTYQLHRTKATEWHRIALAILSLGGDPANLTSSVDSNAEMIDLIADGTYNRGKENDLAAQGINGLIWGLITLDALRYEVPEDAYETRDEMIKRILATQLADGGFSLKHPPADPDMTAMTIQALAPYYNSEQTYEYVRHADKETRIVTVREVIDEALVVLAELQLPSGAFATFETENLESTIQVLIALTALQIDPLEDDRFIKNGHTLWDGILQFRMDDGGFLHAFTYDPENPTSLPDESNSMASEQALYGLTGLLRYYLDQRTLYDFREEMSKDLKKQIQQVTRAIEALNEKSSQSDIETVFKQYLTIPLEERAYVANYSHLADLMEKAKIDNTSESLSQNISTTKGGNGTVTPLFDGEAIETVNVFTEADLLQAESLPNPLTTEAEVVVTKLLDRLQKAENKLNYVDVLDLLTEKKQEVEAIKAEIDSLNATIIEHLYPLEALTMKDQAIITEITERYDALEPYDQGKIQNYEDVERAATQVNNLNRARYITFAGIGLVIGLSVTLFFRIKRRRQRKKQSIEME